MKGFLRRLTREGGDVSTLIGLTGGIGSGKSLAASYFKELGANIIYADQISRQLVEPGQVAWKEISEKFGADCFNQDQSLNREKIAAEVFENDDKRNILESIIHPRVLAEEQKLYKSYQLSNPGAVVIIDSPLLIESGNYKNVDKVILVKCSMYLQIRRVMKRNEKFQEDVKNRLKSQMPLKEKVKYTDYILNNEGTREDLKSQVSSLYPKLKSLV